MNGVIEQLVEEIRDKVYSRKIYMAYPVAYIGINRNDFIPKCFLTKSAAEQYYQKMYDQVVKKYPNLRPTKFIVTDSYMNEGVEPWILNATIPIVENEHITKYKSQIKTDNIVKGCLIIGLGGCAFSMLKPYDKFFAILCVIATVEIFPFCRSFLSPFIRN